MSATAAITGYLTTLQLDTTGSQAFRAVTEVRKLATVGWKRDMVEVTNLTSPNIFKEFIAGVIESQEFTAEMNYLQFSSTPQTDLITNVAATSGQFRPWRVVLPNFGATTKTISSINTGTDVITTTTNHGWFTNQPVTVTNSGGGLPGGIVGGTVYWLKVLSVNTFSLYPTPEDATAATNKIDITTSGSGTNTVNGTTNYSFSAATSMTEQPTIEPSGALVLSVKFKITGSITASP